MSDDLCEHGFRPNPRFDRGSWLDSVGADTEALCVVAGILAEAAGECGHSQHAMRYLLARAAEQGVPKLEAERALSVLRQSERIKTLRAGRPGVPSVIVLRYVPRASRFIEDKPLPTITRYNADTGAYRSMDALEYLAERRLEQVA